MEDSKKIVAQRLKNLLESKNLTQTQFANQVGLSKDTVSKLINGKIALSAPNAILISQKFDVSLDYLYGTVNEVSYNQHVLMIMQKHFLALKEMSVWNGSIAEMHISFSSALADFLDALTNLYEAKIPEDLRVEGERRAKESFLEVIEKTPEPGERRTYVLLDVNLYTAKVVEAIKEAKEEVQGNP